MMLEGYKRLKQTMKILDYEDKIIPNILNIRTLSV